MDAILLPRWSMRIRSWFARHGYNVVIQDVRGRGDSEGEFYPFRHEARDGAETIAWLRKRPESQRPHRHVRLFVPGDDAAAGCGRTAGRFGLHRAGHDGARSVPRLVLSPWRAALGVYARLGTADAEGGRAPPENCAKRATASNRHGRTSRRRPACCRSASILRCTAKACRDTCSIGSIMPSPANIGRRST